MERWWEGLRGSMCINAQHTALQAHTTVLFSYLPFSPISPQCVFFIFRLFSLFFYSLVFFFLTLSFPPYCSLIPIPPLAVLPPFVPALHAEDDTSNFEEPEQAAPRPASASQRGARSLGFQGQDLPFLGWFFSGALTALAKTE